MAHGLGPCQCSEKLSQVDQRILVESFEGKGFQMPEFLSSVRTCQHLRKRFAFSPDM